MELEVVAAVQRHTPVCAYGTRSPCQRRSCEHRRPRAPKRLLTRGDRKARRLRTASAVQHAASVALGRRGRCRLDKRGQDQTRGLQYTERWDAGVTRSSVTQRQKVATPAGGKQPLSHNGQMPSDVADAFNRMVLPSRCNGRQWQRLGGSGAQVWCVPVCFCLRSSRYCSTPVPERLKLVCWPYAAPPVSLAHNRRVSVSARLLARTRWLLRRKCAQRALVEGPRSFATS